MVDYIGTARLRELVSRKGPAASSKSWPAKSKPTTGAGTSSRNRRAMPATRAGGVIELMPTSDGRLYSFKYVNGHPKNTAAGPAHGHRVRRARGRGDRLPVAAVRNDLRHGAAHGGDIRAGRTPHGARRRSRVMALIGNGAQSEFQAIAFHQHARYSRTAAVRHRPPGHRQADAQSRRACSLPGSHDHSLCRHRRGGARRRHRDHGDRRQAQRHSS